MADNSVSFSTTNVVRVMKKQKKEQKRKKGGRKKSNLENLKVTKRKERLSDL